MAETTQKKVLITGGSGLIGGHLSQLLAGQGYQVAWLSRGGPAGNPYQTFRWDVDKREIDEAALENLFAVVHLAGTGVADKRWTAERKREILESRTASTSLLVEKLSGLAEKPEVFVGASAIGYYGADTGDEWVYEASAPGSDFLATVVREWEAASSGIDSLGIRRVLVRVGVVLSDKGGALPEILAPLKWGFGAPLGTGRQWMSWIHIHDICRLMVEAIQNGEYKGVYNGVAPHPATNGEITKAAAKVLSKPLWLPPVPAFALKLLLGEMAQIVLGGNKVSSARASSQGFKFEFTQLDDTLKQLLLH